MWYTSTAVSTGSLVRQLPTAYHRKQRFFLRRYITGEFCYTTLPTTNMAPENRPSQKETNLPSPTFQGLCQFWWGYILFGCIVSTNHEHSDLSLVQLLPAISNPQSRDDVMCFQILNLRNKSLGKKFWLRLWWVFFDKFSKSNSNWNLGS